MIRLNIRKGRTIITKSFKNKIDLDNYVLDHIGTDNKIGNFTDCSNKIWNLNVGTSITVKNVKHNLTISMAGKSRAGKHFVI